MDSADELLKLKNLVKVQDATAKQLRSELALRDRKIRDLQIQAEAARRRLVFCDVPYIDQRAEVESLQHALACAVARVKDIERSISWRITTPLRGFGKVFR